MSTPFRRGESGSIAPEERPSSPGDRSLEERLASERAQGTRKEVVETPRGTIQMIRFTEAPTPIIVDSYTNALRTCEHEIRARLDMRFGEQGLLPMSKHAPEHSQHEVEAGTIQILNVINNTLVQAYGSREQASSDPAYTKPENVAFAAVVALTHDSVQNHILTKDANKNMIMQRYRGAYGNDRSEQVGDPASGFRSEALEQEMRDHQIPGNERASADELYAHLQRYRYGNGEVVFSDAQLKSIGPDIAATYPNFAFTDGKLKVFQPYLDSTMNPDVSLRGFAIAHADLRFLLRQAEFSAFKDGGDAELRETKPWIFATEGDVAQTFSSEQIQQASKEIIGWMQTQVGFAQWQKQLVEESIAQFSGIHASPKAAEIREALKEFFCLVPGEAFDRNIEAARTRADAIRKKYEQLALGQLPGDNTNTSQQSPEVDRHRRDLFRELLQEVQPSRVTSIE